MDLNVAISTATELFDDNDVIFPVSLGRENLKILVSPGSESSGVSSLDAEEAKKFAIEHLATSTPLLATDSSGISQHTESESSDGNDDTDVYGHGGVRKPSEQEQFQKANHQEQHATSEVSVSGSEDGDVNVDEQKLTELQSNGQLEQATITTEKQLAPTCITAESLLPSSPTAADAAAFDDIDTDQILYENLKIMYNGRDILDFCANIANKSWNVQYTFLPEKHFPMFLANRSQYHRLGASGDKREYILGTCSKCSFQYPVTGAALTVDTAIPPTTSITVANSLNNENSTGSGGIGSGIINNINNNTNNNFNASIYNSNNFAPTYTRNSPLNNNSNGNNAASLKSSLSLSSLPATAANTNFNHNNQNHNTGGQSFNMYQNQYNGNNMINNNNNNMSSFKQNNNGNAFAYANNNSNNSINALAAHISNSFNQNFSNSNATNNNGNQNNLTAGNMMNNRPFYNMYRQNPNNSGINNNSHAKMPYKMYSHF